MGSCQELPRTRGGRSRRVRAAVAASLLMVLCGCGRDQARSVPKLTFEAETDTVGLSQGPDLLTSFEPKRYENGLLQLRGGFRFPDHTRVQISLTPKAGGPPVQMVQVTVMNGRFESAPLLGERGPLAVGVYRVEFRTHFNSVWQPEDVLDATDQGRSIRGPGMIRASLKEAAFLLTREQRL